MESYPPPLPADPNARPPVHPARGWLLIVLGVCLSAGMAWLIQWLHQAILQNGAPGARTHWNGSADFTRNVYGLFWAVLVFGLVAVASGAYILRTRRLSWVLWGTMIAIVLVMVYFGYTITTTNVPR